MFRGSSGTDLVRGLAYLSAITFSLSVSILGGFFLGRYLDLRFGTAPLFTAVLVILGATGGMVRVYRIGMSVVSEGEKDDGTRDR